MLPRNTTREARPAESFPPVAVILHEIGVVLAALLGVAVTAGLALSAHGAG